MRTCTFKEVSDRIFRRRGLDPSAVTATQNGLVADFVSERVREGWEYAFWKEWTYLEERAYRPLWYVDATYAAGQEVWNGTDKYYSSVSAGNLGNVLTNTVYWTDITATMTNHILLDQPGQNRIGVIKDIYATEANAQKDLQPLTCYISDDRVIMNDSRAGDTVWVVFRKIAPKFSAEAWSGATTYSEGWIVYFPSSNATQLEGNCYRASLTEKNIEYWDLQQIPEIIEKFVVLAATADYFRNDTQLERADVLEAKAEEELARAYSAASKQSGLYDTARIVVS
jgi:hypothetical protein